MDALFQRQSKRNGTHCVVSILRVFNDMQAQFGSNAKAYGARAQGWRDRRILKKFGRGTQLPAREIARIHVWETAVPVEPLWLASRFEHQRARDASVRLHESNPELDSRLVCSHAGL